MIQYHQHLRDILDRGTIKPAARNGMPGSISLFGYQNRYDLSNGFPLLTTKEIKFDHIVVELLWFLRGDSNIKFLVENSCNIWNEDSYNYYRKLADKYISKRSVQVKFNDFVHILKTKAGQKHSHIPNYNWGDTGEQYPRLWRSWKNFQSETIDGAYRLDEEIDQISNLVEGLKNSPTSRRHIITAWNPATVDDMALPACHSFVQFNVRFDKVDGINYLDCQLYQRSADMFLGVPYNIASYALLTHIIAKITNMVPGDFIHTFGDSHIYDNHMNQVQEILSRDPNKYPLPELEISKDWINMVNTKGISLDSIIHETDIEDFTLSNYESYSPIKAKLSTGLK